MGAYPAEITPAWVPDTVSALLPAGRRDPLGLVVTGVDGSERPARSVGRLALLPAMPRRSALVDLDAVDPRRDRRARDLDGDALTYNWEEIDRGSAGSPTATQTANNNVPLFRSWVPTASPTRYFPRLSDLVANTVVVGERPSS